MNIMKYLAPHWKTPVQRRLKQAMFSSHRTAIDNLVIRYYGNAGGKVRSIEDIYNQAMMNASVSGAGASLMGLDILQHQMNARSISPYDIFRYRP